MQSRQKKRLRLLLFLFMSLFISWAIWVPLAFERMKNPDAPAAGGSPLNMVAVWAPALSAILLARVMGGKAGLQVLLHPIRRWRVGIRWYLFILLYPSASWFLARGIDVSFGRSFAFTIPILSYFPPEQSYMVAVAIVFAFPNALGEEIGWRGFALPSLQASYNALLSSILLGVFWAVWHVPMWVANDLVGLALLRSTAGMIAHAVVFTWVYNNSGGSLLLAWLFHTSITITQYLLQTPLTLSDDIVRWGVAILVVTVAGSTHLSRRKERYRLPG